MEIMGLIAFVVACIALVQIGALRERIVSLEERVNNLDNVKNQMLNDG